MEREHLKGTLMIWPGVAEEDLWEPKAHYMTRRRCSRMSISVCSLTWPIIFRFRITAFGPTAAGWCRWSTCSRARARMRQRLPGAGESALDAVELMDVGWNFRREHLRLATRIHNVITNGGDQPNVVPPNAAVWYYYREMDYEHIMNLWRIGDQHGQRRRNDDGYHL